MTEPADPLSRNPPPPRASKPDVRRAILVLGLVGALPAPAAADSRDCGFTGSVRVVAENSFGRVLKQAGKVRACKANGSAIRRLRGTDVRRVRIDGHFVAYQSTDRGVRSGHVLNLWRGPGVLEVPRIVAGPLANRSGASVWTRAGEVWRVDARGGEKVDEGDALDPYTLAITPLGNRFYWMRDNVPQTAYLRAGSTHAGPPPKRVRRPDAVSCRLTGLVATVAANRFGRVVRRRRRVGDVLYDYFACDARGRNVRRLGARDLDGFISDFVLEGRFTAYTRRVYGKRDVPDKGHAEVVDLTTGRRTIHVTGRELATPVVTRRGVLVVFRTPDEGRTFSLERHDDSGRTVLDPGPDAHATSLALDERGTRVYWLHGREVRTALV